MKVLTYTYQKVNNYYSVETERAGDQVYKNLCQNDIFLKESKGIHILKIRVKNKYPFVRVILRQLIPNEIWFGKFPNSDDLVIIKGIVENKSYKIYIIQNQWRYRFLFLDLININPGILSYNKPTSLPYKGNNYD